MNTNLLLLVGVGALGVYVLTRPKTAVPGYMPPPAQAPSYAPPVYAPQQPASSYNPADLNNYYNNKSSDAAAYANLVGSLVGAAASIYGSYSQSHQNSGATGDPYGYDVGGDPGSYTPY